MKLRGTSIRAIALNGLLVAALGVLAVGAEPAQAWGYRYGHHGGHHGHNRHHGGHFGFSIGYGHRSRHHGFYGRYHGYYPYGYSRPYYGYSGGYSDPYYGHSHRSHQHGYGGTTRTSSNPPTVTAEQGWDLLSKGQSGDAVRVFGSLVQSDKKNGKLKVGYSLAAASAGDLDKGVWVMRRAFRIDPDSLHYLDVGEDLELVMDDLASRYQDTRDHSIPSRDADFMAAAIHYLLHDNTAAADTVDKEDGSKSAVNLKRLIATAPSQQ